MVIGSCAPFVLIFLSHERKVLPAYAGPIKPSRFAIPSFSIHAGWPSWSPADMPHILLITTSGGEDSLGDLILLECYTHFLPDEGSSRKIAWTPLLGRCCI